MEEVRTVKYVGIDDWNRPIFKAVQRKAYYGCVDILFSYGATEQEVREKISESNLCYFGSQFNCEPYGSTGEPLRIEWSA